MQINKQNRSLPVAGSWGINLSDIEVKDYVILQKPQEQDNRLPPPRTLILDFTMTHVRL
jgi:hypothetical protein